MPQVIRFAEDGTVEFTRNTALLGLIPDREKSIVRMTEILFDNKIQKFYVEFKTGPEREALLNIRIIEEYGMHRTDFKKAVYYGTYSTATFDTYEDAVQAELLIVEAMRKLGHSMHE